RPRSARTRRLTAREGLLGYLRAATLLRMVPPPVAEAADDPTDDAATLRAENASLREQLAAVTDIGIALSAERDLRSLLETILTKTRWLASADAGSLYLVEGEGRDRLRFVLAQNDSLRVP